MRRLDIVSFVIMVALCACSEERSFGKLVRSTGGVVVSQAPLATQVGVTVLDQGGNAIDAAVATAFALAVVEPTNSGLGGRTQILIRRSDGEIAAIDATTQVPRGYPVDSIPPASAGTGYGMIGVPGTVAGLTKAVAEHGTWPLARVIQPAVELAENGFRLNEAQARAIASVAEHLLRYEYSRRFFLKPDGTPYEAGDVFVQETLAGTLRRIGEDGAAGFYQGQPATLIEENMMSEGGFVTLEDLAEYRARDAVVVHGTYRGYELVGTYLPAAGANTIEMLQILDHFDLASVAGTSEWASLVGQTLLIGFRDRLSDLANMGPAETFPLAENAMALVSPERAAERARLIRPFEVSSEVRDTVSIAGTFLPGHTTHLSVVDADGGAVALTQSLGPTMGSRVASANGFMFAATMGYLSGDAASAGVRSLGPGDRASSRQSPMMVLKDGELRFVMGGSGSRRILSALVQVTSRMIDQKLSLDAAVASPRVHLEPSQPEILHMQVRDYGAWTGEQIADLRAFGFDVRDQHTQSFGNVSAIARDTITGEWIGVADLGGAGAAAAARR